mgnify:CR=1 FL=1
MSRGSLSTHDSHECGIARRHTQPLYKRIDIVDQMRRQIANFHTGRQPEISLANDRRV